MNEYDKPRANNEGLFTSLSSAEWQSRWLVRLMRDEREEAVELAKQTKTLQAHYDDLVQGRPSILLDIEEEEGFQ
jgi:hypothetical protein